MRPPKAPTIMQAGMILIVGAVTCTTPNLRAEELILKMFPPSPPTIPQREEKNANENTAKAHVTKTFQRC